MLHSDARFVTALRQFKIIRRDDPEFPVWRPKHEAYLAYRNKVSSFGYGLTPAYPTWVTRVSHMFLHGSVSHLLGNMIFLFIVGFVVERLLGSGRFLVCYLITGLAAAEFYILLASTSIIPTIGASGVVSSIMAMYVVLFGLRKVNFFYFVFVYFDYVKLPAIVVLPFWIGNEIFQWMTKANSNVNYLIHLGGLLSGLAAATLLKLTSKTLNFDFHDNLEKQQSARQDLSQVMELLGNLEYDKAHRQLQRLYRQDPDNQELWEPYYRTLKHNPENEDFHEIARKLLSRNVSDKPGADRLHSVYSEYLRIANGKTRMPLSTLSRLARVFSRYGILHDAEKIINTIVKFHADFPDVPNLIFLLAKAFYNLNQFDKYQYYLQFLTRRHPMTAEAHQARLLLNQAQSG